VAKLLAVTDSRMDFNSNKVGAKELAMVFESGAGQASARGDQ
jgi:hypothetical protein